MGGVGGVGGGGVCLQRWVVYVKHQCYDDLSYSLSVVLMFWLMGDYDRSEK